MPEKISPFDNSTDFRQFAFHNWALKVNKILILRAIIYPSQTRNLELDWLEKEEF